MPTGGGAFVNRDVPAGQTVVGIPARPIARKPRDDAHSAPGFHRAPESACEVGLARGGFAPQVKDAFGRPAGDGRLQGVEQLAVAAGDEVLECGLGGPGEVEEELPHGIPRGLRRLGGFRRPA